MKFIRTQNEVEALEVELLGDSGVRILLQDGSVVHCVATRLGRGIAAVFTSTGKHVTYRYEQIRAVFPLENATEIDALVETMQSAGLIVE